MLLYIIIYIDGYLYMGVDGSNGLSQIEVGKTYIHLSVYPFRFGFQPCRLCLHHIAQRNHAFLHSQVGIPQVFFSLVYAAQGGLVSLHALLQFLSALVHLQFYLFLHLFGFIPVHQGFCLGTLHLVGSVAPGEDGNIQRDAYVPHSFHFALETVEHRRVAG